MNTDEIKNKLLAITTQDVKRILKGKLLTVQSVELDCDYSVWRAGQKEPWRRDITDMTLYLNSSVEVHGDSWSYGRRRKWLSDKDSVLGSTNLILLFSNNELRKLAKIEDETALLSKIIDKIGVHLLVETTRWHYVRILSFKSGEMYTADKSEELKSVTKSIGEKEEMIWKLKEEISVLKERKSKLEYHEKCRNS